MDNAEYPTTMALPTEPGRIPGEPKKAVKVDASWLAAHEAARRANPVDGVPAVRTPMPVSRDLYPDPIYDPVDVAPLKQWVKPEPKGPGVRTWLASLLRISKPERVRIDAPPASDDSVVSEEEAQLRESLESTTSAPSTPILSPRQEEYLQRIRVEERRIAEERRRESWDRMLAEYNTHQQFQSTGAPGLAPDPRVRAARSDMFAEVERWQKRSARLSSELGRIEEEKRAALLQVAEAQERAEGAQRAAQSEREQRQQAEEREAAAQAALADAEARVEQEHNTAVLERDERLRIAEEERTAAEAHASEAHALAEQARLAESERRATEVRAKQTARVEQARLAEIKEREAELRRAEEERTAALELAEEERLAAAALTEQHERAEKAHRLELEKREEQLRVAEKERLAAIALAEEKTNAEEARRAELDEREERLRVAEDERLAALALAEAKTKAEEERRAELQEREERLRIAEEERLAAIALAEGATKAEEARLEAIADREERLRAAEVERLAAVELAAEKVRAEEQRRVELEEREERLRVAEEERLAAIALAEEKTKAEAARRAELEDREERLRVAEEERLAAIALAEGAAEAAEARRAVTEEREERLRAAKEQHVAELQEREERLRIAEAERLAAVERAEEERLAARALADEKARIEEKQRMELEDREARLRIAEEDRLAALARAEDERIAAEALAEESARVDELRRLELEERAEQLRLSEAARLAALAQAEEARARAEEALAQAEAARFAQERDERALAEHRERQAKAALEDTPPVPTKEQSGNGAAKGGSRSNGKSKSTREPLSTAAGRGTSPTRRKKRRRKRRTKTTNAVSAPTIQPYAAPRLARIDVAPEQGMDIHIPLQPAVTVVESPADVPSDHQVDTTGLGPILPRYPRGREDGRSTGGSTPPSHPPIIPTHAVGASTASPEPNPLALPPNLRARRGQLLERRSVEPKPSPLRTLMLVAFGGVVLSLAGLIATGNLTRATVLMTEMVERSPITGLVMGIVRPSDQVELPAIDPTLGDYPGASAVVAAVAESFSADLNTLAVNLGIADGPPAAWLTPEYIARPSSYVEVGEYFRRLGNYTVDAPRLMPSLADADMSFRSGFAAAGLTSESLAQQAMSVYVGLQSAWNDHLAAQQTFAQLGAEFDQFLRQNEGTLTYLLGEFGHRSAAVATDATRLHTELGQAFERMEMSRTIVEDRMIDLTISE